MGKGGLTWARRRANSYFLDLGGGKLPKGEKGGQKAKKSGRWEIKVGLEMRARFF